MTKTCISCKWCSEEHFGHGNLDLENCMICACERSTNYDRQILRNDSCDHWASENEGSTISYRCSECDFAWDINDSVSEYSELCPECNSDNIQEI